MIEGNTYPYLHWKPAVQDVQFFNVEFTIASLINTCTIAQFIQPSCIVAGRFGRFRVLEPNYI